VAIDTDDTIDKTGTQDEVTTSSASVADAAFSIASDTSIWPNTDDTPAASFVLAVQWATLPDDGSLINLYARKMNVQGINDSPIPSANNTDQFIGSFLTDGDVAINTDAFLTTPWLTLGNPSQDYEYYIENLTGQTISAGWNLYATSATKGPAT